MKPLKFLGITATIVTLSACMNLKKGVVEDVAKTKKGPENAPTKSITNFSSALRCMDNLMISYGVQPFSVLAEDLSDKTKKLDTGTRDMLITAVSDMTKRSGAVKLIAYGSDSGNLISFLQTAGKQTVYSEIPKFDIRGSISQMDSDIISKNVSAGAGIPEFGVGFSKDASGTILGLDLSMVNTSNMSVIPGVTSRNQILIIKSGSGVDSDGTIRKAGINFAVSFGANEGSAQALRNLIELATVELFGKLLKLPYWTCLGADPENQAIKQEIDDWYYSLNSNNELVGFTQNQLFKRGYYDGVVDGNPSAEYEKSVALMKLDLHMPSDPNVDKSMFAAMLNTPMPESAKSRVAVRPQAENDEPQVADGGAQPQPQQAAAAETQASASADTAAAQAATAAAAAAASAASSDQQVASLGNTGVVDAIESNSLFINAKSNKTTFAPGERLTLVVKSNRSAHMYCFFHDDSKQIMRVFPNRFRKTSFVNAGEEIELPGNMPFEVTAAKNGEPETLGCFTTEKEILDELPTRIRVLDFVSLDVKSMQDIRESVGNLSGNTMAEAYFQIKTR